MRLPRNLNGDDLVKRLRDLGYESTRQTGSHLRLTRIAQGQSTPITIPRHKSLRVGTLNGILSEVADQLDIAKNDLIRQLFG